LTLGKATIFFFVRVGKLYLTQIAIFVLDKEEIKLWVQKKFSSLQYA
jgi:hypothetical protein